MNDQTITAGSTLSPVLGPSVSTPGGGSVDEVTYTIADATIASVCAAGSGPCAVSAPPYTDTPAFAVDLTGQVVNTTTLTVTGVMIDEGGIACTPDTATITVTNPGGWWQVSGGDVAVNGNISSVIPASCVAPGCDPVLITGDPGVPSYTSFITPAASVLPPNISSTDWNTGGSTFPTTQPYNYAFFEAKIPDTVTPTDPPLSTLNIATRISGDLGPEGYYWFLESGDLTITNPGSVSDFSEKVIVFVDGDLTIEGPITVEDGIGFFMAVVSGDITVNPAVGGPQEATPLPDLEGLYITDGDFLTGSTFSPTPDDVQLHVRGVVAAPTGSVILQRNLADNSTTPGELFEYGPDQAILFHPDLAGKRTIWREVAP